VNKGDALFRIREQKAAGNKKKKDKSLK